MGFLTSDVAGKVHSYRIKILQSTIFIFLIGIAGAVIISKRIKKLTFNLEPEEISFLFKEKEATLESIRDATIAVNKDGEVTSINKRARELLKHDDIEKGLKVKHSRLNSLKSGTQGRELWLNRPEGRELRPFSGSQNKIP